MLILNSQEMYELVSYREVIDKIAQAYEIYEEKDFDLPDRIHLHRDDDVFLYMPCFTKKAIGTKMITVFPNNREHNEPAIQGIMLLNDVNTGKPLAIMDGATLTAIRTGAVGGLGVELTTRKDVNSIGLIGAGVQGFNQLVYASKVRKVKEIYIYDIFKDKLEEFRDRLAKELPYIDIYICSSNIELVEKSDVIITTTTATSPVVPNDPELLKGKHFIGIGSYKPDMREFPEELFKMVDKLYIDTEFGKHESGDLITPLKEGWVREEDMVDFSKIVTGKDSINLDTTTLFKSVGMAIFDVVVGNYIYEKAVRDNHGVNINL